MSAKNSRFLSGYSHDAPHSTRQRKLRALLDFHIPGPSSLSLECRLEPFTIREQSLGVVDDAAERNEGGVPAEQFSNRAHRVRTTHKMKIVVALFDLAETVSNPSGPYPVSAATSTVRGSARSDLIAMTLPGSSNTAG